MSPTAPATHERREFASEIKFVLDPATADRVRTWARAHLASDPNAHGAAGDTYRVTSLYFDNADFAVYHRDGPLRYSKFRVRRYDDAALFLERKLKVSGRVAKRRTAITPAELDRLSVAPAGAWSGAWFEQKTAARRLRPVCQIDYARTARVLATAQGPIRLTLDESIRAIPVNEMRFRDPAPALLLTDRVVLELKYRRDLPALFRTLAAEFGLNPLPFSKYRTAVQALNLVPANATTMPAGETAPLAPGLLACPTS